MQRASMVCLGLFLTLMGFLFGSMHTVHRVQRERPLTITASVSPRFSTVRIEEIGSVFSGTASGSVRLFLGDRSVPIEGGKFQVSLVKNITPKTAAPVGMQFVASKRGKYYYRLNTAAANALSEANRLYFPSAEEAESAGYKRR